MAECTECKHCNLGAYHSGKWYCRKISVFKADVDIEKCFEQKGGEKHGDFKLYDNRRCF